MSNKIIELKGLTKNFDDQQVLKGIDLNIYENEFLTLLGPSGCGKTTILRIIAGFEEPSKGELLFNGIDISKVPPYKREINTVFQKYALFPFLNVHDNVAFGLNLKKVDKSVVDQKVSRMLKLVGLEGFEKRDVTLLSGGQQQRVAIARALVNEPKVLLLDEPLGALDAKLRKEMQFELKKIQKEVGITFIFVTHDQEECFSISDKLAVMNGGVIEQFDTPENIYRRPATEFVARFIGFENFLELAKKQDGVYTAPDGSEFLTSMDLDCEKFAGTIRPDDICLADDVQTENVLSGKIGVRTFLGKSYQYEVETSAGVLKVNMGTDHVYKEGEEIRLYLPKDKLILVRR